MTPMGSIDGPESDRVLSTGAKLRRPLAALHMLVHPGEKFFYCRDCQRRHRVDEDCISNPDAMEIQADDRDLARTTQHAFEALMVANNPSRWFRFGGEMVRVTRDERARIGVETMTVARLRHAMATAAQWVTTTKPVGNAPGGKRPAEPPRSVIENMLATPIEDVPLPVLRGITTSPVFTADGILVDRPGYHPTSQLLYAPADGFQVPGVPEVPSNADVALARTLIADELIGDFPFKAASDRAAAVSALLLPFVRDFIQGPVPKIGVEKPTIGTGASLLVELLTFPATGVALPAMTMPKNEEEMRKQLTSALLVIPAFILFDNVTGRLKSASLAAALTATEHQDRRLGRSETVRIPVRCGWLLTGNNPSYDSELVRRVVRCRLDARVDRPWLRDAATFKHPQIREWAKENRGNLVWAALVIVRAWLAAGRPTGTAVASLGSFQSWADVMGGLLSTMGVSGFLEDLVSCNRRK